ncbi:LysR family transcriptional regulator [Amycolatopsis cihanbeyliensis]|uniref:Regulatory helix-turn-helix LysR family protein n=1 Tax=Amycolatopsis cihanbeyliensis TaxID=1128664 RepID=A0A542DE42_AMYCI|nr:LysR family transcriptional regulator [Amycolatopsis cihanbeyliensis]TQJ01344.1 regulatory helix-turn-helix LysR family protein [Amycolatopsis cihanbeyliensis]
MHEQELRAFVLVSETGRIDAAAQQLGSSRLVVGQLIASLEQALQAQLFVHSVRGVQLTPIGKKLLPSVRAALALFQGIKEVSGAAESRGTAYPRDITPFPENRPRTV